MTDNEQSIRAEFYRYLVNLNEVYNLDDINVIAQDLAYFAGIFDTEVHFNIYEPYTLHLSYTKTNRELLVHFLTAVGGEIRKSKMQLGSCKQVWVWMRISVKSAACSG